MNFINDYLRVDSLKIYIPEKKIYFKDYDKLVTYNENTGEVIHEKFRITNKNNMFSLTFGKVNLFGNVYYTIVLTSKLLKERYFEMITLNNIDLVFKNLILEFPNVDFNFTLDEFLMFNVNDIDMANDFYINQSDFDALTNYLAKKLQQTHVYKYKRNYEISGNSGFQYLFRGYNKERHLYFKMYNKRYEFVTRSVEFGNLFPNIPYNLFRIEFNFLNSKQIRKYLLKNSKIPITLNNILSLKLKVDNFFNYDKDKQFNFGSKNVKDIFILELVKNIQQYEKDKQVFFSYLKDNNIYDDYLSYRDNLNNYLNSNNLFHNFFDNTSFLQQLNIILMKFKKQKSFYYRMKKLLNNFGI